MVVLPPQSIMVLLARSLKVGGDTILQAVAGTQQDDEHEDTPGHRKPRQKCTELVFLHGGEDFGQGVKLQQSHVRCKNLIR